MHLHTPKYKNILTFSQKHTPKTNIQTNWNKPKKTQRVIKTKRYRYNITNINTKRHKYTNITTGKQIYNYLHILIQTQTLTITLKHIYIYIYTQTNSINHIMITKSYNINTQSLSDIKRKNRQKIIH